MTQLFPTSPNSTTASPPHKQIIFSRDIEPRKENLQPIRSGRSNLSSLIATSHAQRARQIELFELKIKASPQDINMYIEFVHYLKKVTESFSSDKTYKEVLKRATETLSIQYKSDIRMLRLWLMYLDLVRDPLEAFRWLEANSVGTMFADFWLRWARYIEDRGDYQGAQKLLEMGIERDAKPLSKLKKRQQDYFKRVVYRIKNGIRPEEDAPSIIGGGHLADGLHEQRVMTLATHEDETAVRRQPFGVLHTGAESTLYEEENGITRRKRKREVPLGGASLGELDTNAAKKCRVEESERFNFQVFSDDEPAAPQSSSILAPSQSKRFGFSDSAPTDTAAAPAKRALADRAFVPFEEQSKENQQVVQSLLPTGTSALLAPSIMLGAAATSNSDTAPKSKKKIVSKKKQGTKTGKKNAASRLKIFQDKPAAAQDKKISQSLSRLML